MRPDQMTTLEKSELLIKLARWRVDTLLGLTYREIVVFDEEGVELWRQVFNLRDTFRLPDSALHPDLYQVGNMYLAHRMFRWGMQNLRDTILDQTYYSMCANFAFSGNVSGCLDELIAMARQKAGHKLPDHAANALAAMREQIEFARKLLQEREPIRVLMAMRWLRHASQQVWPNARIGEEIRDLLHIGEEQMLNPGVSCVWLYDSYSDFWQSACDLTFTIEDGAPADHHMTYCPKCGRFIVAVEDEDEEE